MDKAEEIHKQHEVIRDAQRQASEPYAEANPSEVDDIFWIIAHRKVGAYPAPSPQSGKWLIFVPVGKVDETWRQIKQATEEGLLGRSAKVATMRPNANASDPNKKVICVYTYDWTDKEDVMKIRAVLHELGQTQELFYKADQDTMAGKYEARGHKNISKYRL